ncbi:MAG: glutathione S-transferase domain-containing protein [Thermoleophilaceae bacterium]|nr:glutathione S-transferase domain-containing protein [Thermoleophilaceae bacterium]
MNSKMKLYICWGTFPTPRKGGHPCGNAAHALDEAGHEYELKKVYGWGPLPKWMNPMRREVRKLTGNEWVPVLVVNDDEFVQGSQKIIEWARTHTAAAPTA